MLCWGGLGMHFFFSSKLVGNFGEGFGKEEDDIYEQKMKVGEGNVCGD